MSQRCSTLHLSDFQNLPRLTHDGFSLATLAEVLSPNGPCALWENSPSVHIKNNYSEHRVSRFTALAIQPKRIFRLENEYWEIRDNSGKTTRLPVQSENIFAPLENAYAAVLETRPAHTSYEFQDICFSGGFIGFVGYDTGRYFEHIRGATGNQTLPDIFFIETEHVLVYDAQDHTLSILSPNPDSFSTKQTHEEFIAEVQLALRSLRGQTLNNPPSETPTLSLREKMSENSFIELVERAKEYICAGDIFQVVLSNTFTAPASLNPFRLFDKLKVENPSPFHFLIHFGSACYVGASPETMLHGCFGSEQSSVSMRLVAGTYERGTDETQQSQRAQEILEDHKEKAEHLMLVDHIRNDLGRIAKIGSVRVSELFRVESYANIHHLVSEVTASPQNGISPFQTLQACFPIATLTGTPKIRAMEIIAELEGPSRGIFGGAVVALGYNGMLDSTVAIRSALIERNHVSIQAGAGIVYDSNPRREFQECALKAKALIEAMKHCPPGDNLSA